MLLTLTALRVIFRVIRVSFWETAWHTRWPGNHTWILPTKLNMFLLSLCLKTVFFLKIEEWNRGHPFFFFMYYCPKEAKNTNGLREVIMKNNKERISDELRCSQSILLQAWEGWGWEITARYWYQTEPLTWLNVLRPKGKTLHCFCDNDLWQTGKKSVWNTNITAGVVLIGYAAVLWFVTQHSLWGERVAWRNKERKCRRLGW